MGSKGRGLSTGLQKDPLIPLDRYCQLYQELKGKYGPLLVKVRTVAGYEAVGAAILRLVLSFCRTGLKLRTHTSLCTRISL